MCFAIALTSMPGVCWKKARDFSHLNIRSRSSANQSNVDICIVAWRRPKENTIIAVGSCWKRVSKYVRRRYLKSSIISLLIHRNGPNGTGTLVYKLVHTKYAQHCAVYITGTKGVGQTNVPGSCAYHVHPR